MMELINGRCGNELFKTWRVWEVAWVVCVHSLYGCLVCHPGRENSRFLGVELLTLTGSNFKRVQALTLLAFFLITLTVYAYYEKKNQKSTKLFSLEINNTSGLFSAYWFLWLSHVCCNSYYSYNHYWYTLIYHKYILALTH